jgi:hypothetical protein
VILAELEVRHSRAIAPTRRVALGDVYLPTDPAPGFGGILLAGMVAAYSRRLEEEIRDDLDLLIDDLERGRRVAQPRVRYRFQTDVHGLARTRHRLRGVGEAMELELDEDASGLPQVLAAVYAASKLSSRFRPAVFALIWRATRWEGEVDAHLVDYLTGDEAAYRVRRDRSYDAGWALTILGFDDGTDPRRADVVRRFRLLVRDAHPDHGAEAAGAGLRITELTEAKRILLARS